MFGFHNQLLVIDAGRKSFERKPVADELLRTTLGGKGLGTHLLLEHNPPAVDPLAPENHLIFATGPAAGSAIWGSCRHGVFTKSLPETGKVITRDQMDRLMKDYYKARGWDEKGRPGGLL